MGSRLTRRRSGTIYRWRIAELARKKQQGIWDSLTNL
jgi:hypothetical protein